MDEMTLEEGQLAWGCARRKPIESRGGAVAQMLAKLDTGHKILLLL